MGGRGFGLSVAEPDGLDIDRRRQRRNLLAHGRRRRRKRWAARRDSLASAERARRVQ